MCFKCSLVRQLGGGLLVAWTVVPCYFVCGFCKEFIDFFMTGSGLETNAVSWFKHCSTSYDVNSTNMYK